MVRPVLTAQAARRRLAAKLLFAALLAASPRALAQDEEGEQAAEPAAEEKAEEAPAAAEEQKKPAEATTAEAEPEEKQFGHGGQAGLRVALNGGYRMVFRFDKSPLCHAYDDTKEPRKQQKFCGHVAPFAVDLALSYAPFDSVEPFLWARFGVTRESFDDGTHTNRVDILGAGVRLYTMSESAFKIFIEPAFAMELESGETGDLARQRGLVDLDYKTDILFHAVAGAQVDVSENFGFFLDAGLTTGVLRAIHSTLEVNLGIQGRI